MTEHTTLADLEDRPHAEVFEPPRPRTVRLALDADETHTLEAGDLIRFSGNRAVSPYAVEPSTAVVVFA